MKIKVPFKVFRQRPSYVVLAFQLRRYEFVDCPENARSRFQRKEEIALREDLKALGIGPHFSEEEMSAWQRADFRKLIGPQ